MTWLDRQSFLGADSDRRLAAATVGLVGLGGGNSHVAQQLAHLGVGGFVLVDDDRIALSNLNRLVGGTLFDVILRAYKTAIAARVIRRVNPRARIVTRRAQWQTVAEDLKRCDLVLAGVDGVRAKAELEAFCRRFMIPMIDQGMDVHDLGEGAGFLVAGQVALSLPGQPCLRCLGLVTDEALDREARNYGAAGGKPQVVWPNGVLASTAVGLAVQLITPWCDGPRSGAYLVYDANLGVVTEADRLKRRGDKPCPHYPPEAVGDPGFDIRRPQRAGAPPRPGLRERAGAAWAGAWRRLLVRLSARVSA